MRFKVKELIHFGAEFGDAPGATSELNHEVEAPDEASLRAKLKHATDLTNQMMGTHVVHDIISVTPITEDDVLNAEYLY